VYRRWFLALSATIYKFDIDLADGDRHVYETLTLQVARHPSESDSYLIARVLAYALEYTEGIGFSKGGVSDPEEPAILVRDMTGAIAVWIEVGLPDAARLHKASKSSPRVAVYTHRDAAQLLSRLSGERIHRADSLELYAIDQDLIAALVDRLDRRMGFALSVNDREIYLSIASETLTGRVVRHALLNS
jgi:uncharacterized protein YaeQ